MTRKSSNNLRLFRRYLANSSSTSISQETLEEDEECQFDQSRIIMNNRNTTPILGRRSRSMNRSVDSTDSSNSSGQGMHELPTKSTYRILVLGASKTGKTSIVRQFLYDQFSPVHTETMDDMYRGEFEDANGLTVNFDIQDVGGGFVYEFPGMRNVSLASADAFLLVFSLESAETWAEVEKLRDMVIEAKDPDCPIVIVANKSDLPVDKGLPHESLEATAIFDWENGYVQCSAKDRININKIFKELLNQAKSRFDVSVRPVRRGSITQAMNSEAVARHLPYLMMHQKLAHSEEYGLKRRQSLPAAPPIQKLKNVDEESDEVFTSTTSSKKNSQAKSNGATPKQRRSSLALLRRDSCKIS